MLLSSEDVPLNHLPRWAEASAKLAAAIEDGGEDRLDEGRVKWGDEFN